MSAQQDTVAPVHDIARVRGELFRNQLDDVAIKAALDISRATLERYVQSGLPHYKLGRRRSSTPKPCGPGSFRIK
jgi:transposase